jgi:hypothetical protein
MPAKKYQVSLSMEQRAEVEQISRSNKHSTRERTRARILLAADSQQAGGAGSDQAICDMVRTTQPTVERVRRRFAEGGVARALYHQEQATRKAPVIDGEGEAHLIALVCGAPPKGHQQWTLRLLTNRYIEAGYTDRVSYETIRQVLKKRTEALAEKDVGDPG